MMENIFDTAVIVEGNKEILSFVVKELAGTEYIVDDIFFRCTVYILKSLLAGRLEGSRNELSED